MRADKMVGYGDVMKVMGELNRAGFRKIGLVTELRNRPSCRR